MRVLPLKQFDRMLDQNWRTGPEMDLRVFHSPSLTGDYCHYKCYVRLVQFKNATPTLFSSLKYRIENPVVDAF